jgi:phosphatidylglycerol:prolipoprotein diacylglycerol transferase
LHPSVEIFGLKIPVYFLTIQAAAILSWAAGARVLERAGIGRRKAFIALAACTLGAVAGARVLSVLSAPLVYERGSWKILAAMLVKAGGISFLGALMGGLISFLACMLFFRGPILYVLDGVFPAAYAALGVGRIGCLCGGCCFGKPTLFPVALEFEDFASSARPVGVPLHATQLYEMAAAFLCAAALYLAAKKFRMRAGKVTVLGLVLYPAARFFLDDLRGGTRLFFMGTSFMQWICVLLIVSGASLLTWLTFRRRIWRENLRGFLVIPCLFIFLSSCNRHAALPPGRCLGDLDCIYGDSCVAGRCVFTHVLDFEVRFVNMFSRSIEGSLIVEASRCKGPPGSSPCNGKIVRYVEPAPKFPVRLVFDKLPYGRYLVVAGIDIGGDGDLGRGDIAGMSLVSMAEAPGRDASSEEGIVTVQYPYSFFMNSVAELRHRDSFWDPLP